MEQVGYDMYNRLLNEVVQELKGEDIQEMDEEITIDISLSAFIPENYIDNTNQKIEIYQDIADSHDEESLQNVTDEIIDRYGKMPEQVEYGKRNINSKDSTKTNGYCFHTFKNFR